MSIKKLAKAINNLADAITYHANVTTPGAHYAGPVKADGCDGFATSPDIEGKVYAAERHKAEPADFVALPKVLYPAPVTVKGGQLLDTASQSAVDFSDDMAIDNSEEYVDPYDAPKMDAPGWQTLTVADLEESPLSEDHGVLVDLDTEEAEIKALKERNNPPAPPVDNLPPPPVDNLPPAPAPLAPPAPVVADVPVDNSVEVDSAGLPWDGRIHSGGKTKLADGTWRDKRGVGDSEREAIVAELTKVMAIPVPAPAVIEHTAPTDAEGWEQLAADIKQNAPAPAAITTLPEFVRAVTGAKLGNMMVTEAVKSVGLESITQLGARPDLIPAVAAELGL